jgi:hypothetical protein
MIMVDSAFGRDKLKKKVLNLSETSLKSSLTRSLFFHQALIEHHKVKGETFSPPDV